MLTSYTKYDEIRAALGVAEEEIPDDVLALPNYEFVLQFDLEELGDFTPEVGDYYLTLIDSAYLPSATVNEKRFIAILQVYAAYVIARHLLGTLDMFAPQIIKDSKTELGRISDPYTSTKASVSSFYQLMRDRLLAAYLVLFPATVVVSPAIFKALTAVGLGSDPVTGT